MNTVLDVGILRDAAELRSQPRGLTILAAEARAHEAGCSPPSSTLETATASCLGHNSQRFWIPGDIIEAGVRRVQSPLAAIRAANWARTDRQAALILVVVVQQGIVRPTDLFDVIKRFKRMRRRALIVGVLGDVLHGVQSLGELDFARECRRRGLPKSSRHVIRQGKRGRVYLDVYFDDFGLVIEIEGAHHDEVLNSIDDALRQNHLSRGAEDFRRIPVVGFRTDRGVFMQQVVDKLVNKGWRRPI